METSITLDNVYAPSGDVVAREIEGELIIVPLASGVGDAEDELYTLNETGQAIWSRLDGARSLRAIAQELSTEYNAPIANLERDVIGLAGELARRKMILVK